MAQAPRSSTRRARLPSGGDGHASRRAWSAAVLALSLGGCASTEDSCERFKRVAADDGLRELIVQATQDQLRRGQLGSDRGIRSRIGFPRVIYGVRIDPRLATLGLGDRVEERVLLRDGRVAGIHLGSRD